MTVNWAIRQLRRAQASDEQIRIILTLVEVNAFNTPSFIGLNAEQTLLEALYHLKSAEREYNDLDPLDREEGYDNFWDFLAQTPEVEFDFKFFMEVFDELNKRGEEKYGFRQFT